MFIKKPFIEFIKFAKVGVIITLLSLALSFLFLKVIKTPLIPTYIILYGAMIFLSFIINSTYTFNSKRSIKKLVLYFSSYALSLVFGVFLLTVFRKTLPFENWILAYLVIPFTMTSNFVLSSFIFKTRNGR